MRNPIVRPWMAVPLLVGLALPPLGRATEIIVDQKHAQASDQNPGTLAAPLKTIQAGLDKAQPGDTVQVRGGVYHESVRFRRGGSYPGGAIEPWGPRDLKWLTLEAYQDERAVLDGAVTIPADQWELVKGCTNTYATPFESAEAEYHRVNQVFRDGTSILPTLRNIAGKNSSQIAGAPSSIMPAMPDDGPGDEGFYYDHQQKQLFVNLGGRVPGKDAQVRATQLQTGVDAANQSFYRIRKLEVRNYIGTGIGVYNGHDFIAEDNYVHHCGHGFWGSPTSGGFIRRNTITDIVKLGLGIGGARGTTVEENVIMRTHANPYKIVAWDGSAVNCNGARGLVFRNNIVTDCYDASGFWPDVCAVGIASYGNAMYGLRNCGYYIEAGVYGAILRWNTVFDNDAGIIFRQNWGNAAFENYVFRNRRQGLGMYSCDNDNYPKANSMVYNWVIDNGMGSSFGPDRTNEPAQTFDHNTYRLAPDGVILQYGSKQYKDLGALRAEVGQEIHGKVVTEFDPAPLGLVTFRVHGTKQSWEPVPMFGNPVPDRQDVLESSDGTPYFWQKGSFQGVERYAWRGAGCGYETSTRADGSGLVRLLWAASTRTDGGVFDDPTAVRTNHIAALQVGAAPTPDKIVSADGIGYWSVSLPTTDGAQIDLSLWNRAKAVKAVKDNGGLYVTAQFCDETGQNVTRQYLVGADDGQKAAGADWITGDYLYRPLTGTVTAPQGARWLQLGFGLRNCSGWTAFNDIDIQTRPGTPEKGAAKILPIDAKQFTWTPCDLTGLLNRPLADDVDSDGKGGWTDQGPTMDLRNLRAGDYTWNDVVCRVAQGNACFIMKNKRRPSENLPASGKVDLKAKADVLAFLHTGGWIDADRPQATYIIHYADGTKVEIPVVGGKNIFDWVAPPSRADEVKYNPSLGLVLPAVSVPSQQFVHVTVWMLLWKNPHPEKEIQALEVVGANEGIPGLIAVSLGQRKISR